MTGQRNQSEGVRPAAVAGRFYPGDPAELCREVEGFLIGESQHSAAGIMVPHAGYVYSGAIAGRVFASVRIPETCIVVCPNHTGHGPRIAVATRGAFAIPGGTVAIDDELAAAIVSGFPGAQSDMSAHAGEHAIEVELPFLKARNPEVRIVPIVLGGLSVDECVDFGRAVHRIVTGLGRDVLVVASSDMSHYLPDDECRTTDRRALAPLLAFDPEGLYRTVRDHDISMCGVIPTTAMLSYARAAGAQAPILSGYATSGDAFGDRSRVVGYAGVVVPLAPPEH